jgi:hypothetical protein
VLSANAEIDVIDAIASNTDEAASAGLKGIRVVFTVVYSVALGQLVERNRCDVRLGYHLMTHKIYS